MKPEPHEEHINRTGIAFHPDLARSLAREAQATEPSSEGDATEVASVRVAYASGSDAVGSMPVPAADRAEGELDETSLMIFLDKLGERLAFERSGVRLYDALISKHEAFGSWEGGPSREDLEEIRADEKEHFLIVRQAIADLGGDPTAVTPSANLQAVASHGLCQVLSDPRTTLRESLDAILTAELVDNDAWMTLLTLAASNGDEELSEKFGTALEEETDHLFRVRSWIAASMGQPSLISGVSGDGTEKKGSKKKGASKKKSSGSSKKKSGTR